MKPVAECHRVTPGLSFWQGYNPDVKVDCSSSAFRTPFGWIVIDPIPVAETALAEATDGERLAGIILTSGNHPRASLALRERYGAPIYAPLEAREEVEADSLLSEGDVVAGALEVIALPGGGPGEIALAAEGVLFVGDALIHLDGLTVLPPKYCADHKMLVKSLRKLLDHDFHTICFAHGWPLIRGAREKLAALLTP